MESIFEKVYEKLDETFGFKLVKLEGQTATFALIDTVPKPDYTKHKLISSEKCKYAGLEATFLAFILLNGRSASESKF